MRINLLSASLGLCVLVSGPLMADEAQDLRNQLELLKTQNEILKLQKEMATSQAEILKAQYGVSTYNALTGATEGKSIAEADRDAALAKAKAKYADAVALKEILGDTKATTVDGSIAFKSDNAPVMLQSRQGGLMATRDIANELCDAVGSNPEVKRVLNAKGARVIPIDETKLASIVAAKLRTSRFDALYEAIVAETNLGGLPGGVGKRPGSGLMDQRPVSAFALIPSLIAVSQGLNLVNGVAGAIRTTKSISLNDVQTARKDLFESRLSACNNVFATVSLTRQGERSRLQTKLKEFGEKLQTMQLFATTVAEERKHFDALTKGKQTTKNEAIKQREALVARIAALNLTDDVVLEDLAMNVMEDSIKSNPIMTYTLAVQDIQIAKDRFLINDKITFQGTAEVVFQVTDVKGNILYGDAISHTTDAFDAHSMKSVKAKPTKSTGMIQ
jgi:hypothetical protein